MCDLRCEIKNPVGAALAAKDRSQEVVSITPSLQYSITIRSQESEIRIQKRENLAQGAKDGKDI